MSETRTLATVHNVDRAIVALRTPDAAFARVPNTVRQSLADIIEAQQAALADIAGSMTRPWLDPAEHANWCIERPAPERQG